MHARGVGDRLAAPELQLVGAQHDRQPRRAGATAASNEIRVRVDGFEK